MELSIVLQAVAIISLLTSVAFTEANGGLNKLVFKLFPLLAAFGLLFNIVKAGI